MQRACRWENTTPQALCPMHQSGKQWREWNLENIREWSATKCSFYLDISLLALFRLLWVLPITPSALSTITKAPGTTCLQGFPPYLDCESITRYLWTFPCTHSTFTNRAFPSALPLTTHWWIEVWLQLHHTNAWYVHPWILTSIWYIPAQLNTAYITLGIQKPPPLLCGIAVGNACAHCSCSTLAQVLFLHLWPQYHQVEGEKRETLGVGRSRKLWGFVRKSTGFHYLRYQQRAGNLWFI